MSVATIKRTNIKGAVQTSTPATPIKGEYKTVPTESIVPRGLNPRQTFNETKLEELTNSVREKGVLEPLLLRPLTKPKGKARYELIAGERRWRAATRARCPEVPVYVADYSDQEALEIAIIENEQRDDVPILEKAEGYQRLMKQYGYSAEMLAARIHKSEAEIHSTVKLLNIPEFAKPYLNDNTISKSHAEIIARVPSEQGRIELAKKIIFAHDGKTIEVASVRHAKNLADEFTKELSKAPFDTADEHLVAGVPACTNCPFRSGCNRLDYPDGRADICNNVVCYQSKVEAARSIKLAALESKGVKIIPDVEAKKMMPYGYISNPGPYVELKGTCWQDKDNRSYKQLVGKEIQIHVAVDPRDGEIHELARRDELDATLLSQHGIKMNGRSQPSKEQVEHKLRSAARANVIPRVLEKVALAFQRQAVGSFAAKFDKSLRITASTMLERIETDALRMICKRRGIEAKGEYPNFAKLVRAQLAAMSGPEIYGLMGECFIAAPLHSWKSYYSSDIRSGVGYEEIFKSAGVDIKALEREELQALKLKQAERANKAKQAAKKKTTAGKKKI